MKRIISSILTAVIAFGILPPLLMETAAQGEQGYTLTYAATAGGAAVTGITANSAVDVVVPSCVVINNTALTVKQISARAFASNLYVKSVTLPDTITTIENRAFADCFNLEKVNIPEGVEKLEVYTFSQCFALKELVLPAALTQIHCAAIKKCSSLARLVVKAEAFSIVGETAAEKYSTFLPDFSAQQSETPEVFTENRAFLGGFVYGYTKYFVRNDSVKAVFTSVGVPSEYVYSGSQYGITDGLEDGSFKFEGTRTPNGNTAVITGFADMKKPAVKTVLNIPSTVSAGGNSYTVTAIGEKAFSGAKANSASDKITGVNIPAAVTEIRPGAFKNCNIERLTIPGNVRFVGRSAFETNYELMEITIEDGVKGIDYSAFYNSAVRYLVIPESVRFFNLSAVNNCTYLSRLVLGSADVLVQDSFASSSINTNAGEALKVYVRTEALKQKLASAGAARNNITVVSGKMLVLKPGYNYNIPDVAEVGDDGYTLPAPPRRALFLFQNWTDGKNTYSAGDVYSFSGNFSVMEASWAFNGEDTAKVTSAIIAENRINDSCYTAVLKKDERGILNSTVTVNAVVNENNIVRNTVSYLGSAYDAEANSKAFVDINTGELSEQFKSAAGSIYPLKLARGDLQSFTGLFDDYSIYTNPDTREEALFKLKRAVNGVIKSVRLINPNVKFMFILPVYSESQDYYISPSACVNLHRFFTDSAAESEWGSLREATGENALDIVAYELGNETYYNCRYLEENEENRRFIDADCRAYAQDAALYYDAIKAIAPDMEFSGSMVSGTGFWQDEWNRCAIRYINKYCSGLYSLHTYYSVNNTPARMINAVCDRITELYRDEAGYDSDIRFAHTEHNIWGDSYTRNSLYAALASMMFVNTLQKRSDTFCANSFVLNSGLPRHWNTVFDVGGEFAAEPVSDIFKLYIEKTGDRVVEVSYNEFVSRDGSGRVYPIVKTNREPNYTLSVNAAAKGSDTLIISMVNTYPGTGSFDAVTVNFDFLNEYTLTEETVLTAPNPFSQSVNAETKNITDIYTAERNEGGFSSYTIAPNSAAFLTLKTTGTIPQYSSQTGKLRKERQTVVYSDILYPLAPDENGVIELNNLTEIERVLYSGSDENMRVKARNSEGKWETIATYRSFENGSMFNSFTDSLFDVVKIENAEQSEVSILSAPEHAGVIDVFTGSGYVKLCPRINGTDYFESPEITVDGDKLSVINGGLLCVNHSGRETLTVEGIPLEVYITYRGAKKSIKENFENGISDWKKTDFNGVFTVEADGFDESDANSAVMDGGFLKLNGLCPDAQVKNHAAVYYNGDVSMNSKGLIKFDILRSEPVSEYGIRFMVHNDEKNYYQLGLTKFSGLKNNRAFVLSKVIGGVKTELISGIYPSPMYDAGFGFEVFYDGGEIKWRVKTLSDGVEADYLCGSYIDETPFDVSSCTFGFYNFGGKEAAYRNSWVYVDNVSADMCSDSVNEYDYGIAGGKAAIEGRYGVPFDFSADMNAPAAVDRIPTGFVGGIAVPDSGTSDFSADISYINHEGRAKTCITAGETVNGYYILAVSKNNVLKKVYVKNVCVSKGTCTVFDNAAAEICTGAEVSVFLVDSVEALKPLAKKYVFSE